MLDTPRTVNGSSGGGGGEEASLSVYQANHFERSKTELMYLLHTLNNKDNYILSNHNNSRLSTSP